MRLMLVGIVVLCTVAAANAQPVTLLCGGVMHEYQPERIDRQIKDTAATVDLQAKALETPVGKFRITRIEDEKIAFDEPGSALIAAGTLDRYSGKLTVSWQTPEEERKLREGLTAKMTRYSELTCKPGQRLF